MSTSVHLSTSVCLPGNNKADHEVAKGPSYSHHLQWILWANKENEDQRSKGQENR